MWASPSTVDACGIPSLIFSIASSKRAKHKRKGLHMLYIEGTVLYEKKKKKKKEIFKLQSDSLGTRERRRRICVNKQGSAFALVLGMCSFGVSMLGLHHYLNLLIDDHPPCGCGYPHISFIGLSDHMHAFALWATRIKPKAKFLFCRFSRPTLNH